MGDIESEIHSIDILCNLILAFDGVTGSDKIPYFIERLQNFITTCNNNARDIREAMYIDLENSLFFFSDYMDMPIVSEEQ
jgi:hypothetical protein